MNCFFVKSNKVTKSGPRLLKITIAWYTLVSMMRCGKALVLKPTDHLLQERWRNLNKEWDAIKPKEGDPIRDDFEQFCKTQKSEDVLILLSRTFLAKNRKRTI